jgi:coenzyme Q-binding protein COQ10
MPSFITRRAVAHSADAMFALVADVEKYPEFVPLCESLRIQSRESRSDGRERVIARMAVGYGPIQEAFVSDVLLDPVKRLIVASYIDGPFRSLENRWTFRDDPDNAGCEVEFFIAYEFKSLPLQILMGAMFDKAFRKFTAAFEGRANALYGKQPAVAAATLPLLKTASIERV